MTLDELIEKLQAARVLIGGDVCPMAQQDYDMSYGKNNCISKVEMGSSYVWIKYWR
jgi:hypothetical protein